MSRINGVGAAYVAKHQAGYHGGDQASALAHNTRMAAVASGLAAVFWGTNFEATRIALESLSPWTAAVARFAVAALAILLYLSFSKGLKLDVLRRNWLAFVVLGVIGVFGFNAALFVGMKTSSPVTAALIMGTSPLTTNLLEALLHRRMPKGIVVGGMVLSLIGVALTVGAFSGAHFASGDVLIVVGSVAWALYTIGCRVWVKAATPLETSAWTMVTGTLALVGMAFLLENPAVVLEHASTAALVASLHMALIGSVLAYVFWQVGIAVRGPGATSILFNLVPVSALIIAAFFGRIPDISQIIGVLVAITGVLIASGQISFGRGHKKAVCPA